MPRRHRLSLPRMPRFLTGLGLVAILVLPAPAVLVAPARAAEPALGLAALMERARTENPDLQAARLRGQAAQAKTGYAGALDAPKLGVSLMDIQTLGGPAVTLSQMFPGGSKRGLKTEAAQHEAAVVEAEVIQKELEVARELQQAYYEHVYVQRARVINRLTLEQMRNLRKIADAKYAVGSGVQQDSLRAQREVSKLLDKGLKLDAEATSTLAWVNTLANRPAQAAVAFPKDLPALPAVPKVADLLAAAEAHSPMLKAAQARQEAQAAMFRLSQQEQGVPDFEVGVEAGRSMPGDMAYIGGMVGISLPWLSQGRYEGAVKESQSRLAAEEAAYQAEKNRLTGEIHRVLAELQRQERQVQLYEQGLLPQAMQALKAALAAYQVSKTDFDTVLESQTAIYDVQSDEARAKADFHQTMAKLEALVGIRLGASATK